MSSIRQDAWSKDEDLLLAEVVLRNIREGGTQLHAFEEVGKQLSRTSAACGFRWNSYVRKQYRSGIELAKKQRKDAKKTPYLLKEENQKEVQPPTSPSKKEANKVVLEEKVTSFNAVIDFLRNLYERAEAADRSKQERESSLNHVQELEKKVFYLAAENEKLAKNLKEIEDDYRSLIEIMDRARKIFVLQDEERMQKVKFQMDKNGNLERVE